VNLSGLLSNTYVSRVNKSDTHVNDMLPHVILPSVNHM
jgi:hypothetical protein